MKRLSALVLTLVPLLFMSCGNRPNTTQDAPPVIQSAPPNVVSRDTVMLLSGDTLFLLGTDTSWYNSLDSIAFGRMRNMRGARLNNGGYQGAHTWLKWTNDRYACFGFGCGSACWGIQMIELIDDQPIVERMYTVLEDSALNVLCYADTGYTARGEHTFIVEQIGTGLLHRATVPLERVAVPGASIDSAWRSEATVCLRRYSDKRIECFEVPWLRRGAAAVGR